MRNDVAEVERIRRRDRPRCRSRREAARVVAERHDTDVRRRDARVETVDVAARALRADDHAGRGGEHAGHVMAEVVLLAGIFLRIVQRQHVVDHRHLRDGRGEESFGHEVQENGRARSTNVPSERRLDPDEPREMARGAPLGAHERRHAHDARVLRLHGFRARGEHGQALTEGVEGVDHLKGRDPEPRRALTDDGGIDRDRRRRAHRARSARSDR